MGAPIPVLPSSFVAEPATPTGSGVEDAALLHLELGLAQYALLSKLTQLLELLQLAVHVVGRCRRWLGVSGLWLGGLLLLGPAPRLATRDAVGHGGSRPGHDGRPGHSSK